MSIIANVLVPVEFAATQVDEYGRMRLFTQLIKGISRVFRKSLKYFNTTAISASFVLPAAGLFAIILS